MTLSIEDIIINQIKDIITEQKNDPNLFTFEKKNDKLYITKEHQAVEFDYIHFRLCQILKKTDKWITAITDAIDPLLTQEWVVTLNANVTEKERKKIMENKNIKIQHVYNHVMDGFSCVASTKEINKLNVNNTHVIQNNVRVEIAVIRDSLKKLKATNLSQTVGPFIPRLGANKSSQRVGTGSPVTPISTDVYVFVVDTGIDSTHPELNVDASLSRNFVSGETQWEDLNGHGTHVSGIIGARDNALGIVGIAPNVRLIAIRVLDANGSGYISDIIAGLDYVAQWKQNNPSKKGIVNMSLGGSANNAFDNAVKSLISKNVTVVVAAGNSGANVSFSSPARVSTAITVAAYDPTNNTAPYWTNVGKGVDLCAPGVNIDSTFLGDGYAVYSGTSMASPMVTGTIACLLTTNPSLNTPSAISTRLINDAKSLSPKNNDNSTGSNPNVILSQAQRNAQTTNRSVYSGGY